MAFATRQASGDMMPTEQNHPFYRPLWRRVVIVAVTAIWAGVEVFHARDGFWTVLAVAVCAYAAWTFLINYKAPSE